MKRVFGLVEVGFLRSFLESTYGWAEKRRERRKWVCSVGCSWRKGGGFLEVFS